MGTIKLKRPIKDAAGTGEVSELKIKDESEMSASDFYDVVISSSGEMRLGDMAGTIANLTGITEEQVASLHPSDYIKLSGEVGKYLE